MAELWQQKDQAAQMCSWAAGTPLPERFADQFAPWDFGSADVARGCSGTLLRLALRTPEQAAASGVSKVTALVCNLPALELFQQRDGFRCVLGPSLCTLPCGCAQNPESNLQLQESWSEDSAAKLLGDFVAAVTPSLLFQRHLRRVRVMCFEADALEPYLMAQVCCRCRTLIMHAQVYMAFAACLGDRMLSTDEATG